MQHSLETFGLANEMPDMDDDGGFDDDVGDVSTLSKFYPREKTYSLFSGILCYVHVQRPYFHGIGYPALRRIYFNTLYCFTFFTQQLRSAQLAGWNTTQ